MKLQDFIENGMTVRNNMGEIRKTTKSSIVFPNGWVGSIVKKDNGDYSVAVCDYDGYFNWNILKPYGNDKGVIICKNEEDICNALFIIKALN